MADQTLTLRIRAVDEASGVIGGLKKKMSGFMGGVGVPSAGKGGFFGGLGTGVLSGITGGLVGAGAFTAINILTKLVGIGVDFLKKIWAVTLESSGYLKASFKLFHFALENIFRPLGDTLGRLLLPSIIELTKKTGANYLAFQTAARGAEPAELTGIMTEYMGANMDAFDQFLNDALPYVQTFLDNTMPYVKTFLDDVMPLIADAVGKWGPTIIASIASGFAQTKTVPIATEFAKIKESGFWEYLFGKHATPIVPPSGVANQVTVNVSGSIYGTNDIEQTVLNALAQVRQESRVVY